MTQAHDILPDFDDMVEVAEKIKQLKLEKANLDNKIKAGQAETYRVAMTNPKYFSNNKPPSVSYVRAMYEYTGLNGELVSVREAYAKTCAEIDNLQTQFDIMKTKIDIYRTESANKRASL
jgi:hypothetical protein